MARIQECDICKKPTEKIVFKLFLTPLSKRKSKNSFHNMYEFHLDVGICCGEKLKRGFRWTQRMSAAEYHASRKAK